MKKKEKDTNKYDENKLNLTKKADRIKWVDANNRKIKKYIKDSMEENKNIAKKNSPKQISERKKLENRYKEEVDSLINVKPFRCKCTVNNIDISEYLNEIRYTEDEEKLLVLYIKGNKIMGKTIIAEGYKSRCFYSKENMNIINRNIKKYNANLYFCHNHPYSIAAFPSRMDTSTHIHKLKSFIKYNAKIIDWGVVTKYDYYSYKQKGALVKEECSSKFLKPETAKKLLDLERRFHEYELQEQEIILKEIKIIKAEIKLINNEEQSLRKEISKGKRKKKTPIKE